MNITVLDLIKEGVYENKWAFAYYDEEPSKETTTVAEWEKWQEGKAQRHKEHKAAYRAESQRLVDHFRADLEKSYKMKDHPKADILFNMAWSRGHSSGYESVYWEYDELYALVS